MSPSVPTAWWARIPVALALALATLIAPGLAGAAHADASDVYVYAYGVRYGTVLYGATAEVFDVDPTTHPDATPTASTQTSGNWVRLPIGAGDHWIRMSQRGYTPQVRFLATSASPQYVGIGLTVDPDLAGTLSGRIMDEGGTPFTAGRGSVVIYDARHQQVGSARTDDSGNYRVTAPPGDYRLYLSDAQGDRPDVWIGGSSLETAEVFSLGDAGSVTIPGVTMRPGPKLTGVVKDEAGQPIPHARVELYSADNGTHYQRSVMTTTNGSYVMSNIAHGTYKVRFSDPNGDYVGEWFDDQIEFASARSLEISSDIVANADLTATPVVDEPRRLTGTVLDTAGDPLRSSYVEAFRKSFIGGEWVWELVTSALTNKVGRYAFADLDAGTYTVRVSAYSDTTEFETQWYGGTYNDRTAKTIVIPDEGTVTAETMEVVRNGTIRGVVAVPSMPGTGSTSRVVDLFDADGRLAGSTYTTYLGAYTFRGVKPGTYTARAAGYQWFESGGVTRQVDFVSQWWRQASSMLTAKRATVTPGGELTGIDFLLSAQLTIVTPPSVSGTGAYGTTLTASPGTWNRQTGTAFTYQWTRNGAPIAGATKTTYTTTAADLGRKVAVTVTATDKYELLGAGTATSAAKVVKGKATLGASAKGAKKSATVKVRLGLQGITAARTTGIVRIYDGRKLKKTLTVRKGTAAVKVTGLKKGKHTLTVKFAGSGSHTAAAKSTTVKIR